MPHKSLTKVFDVRFYLDNLAAVHLFLKGRVQNARAVLDARTDFRKIVTKFADKRNENILKSNTSIDKELVQVSLILEYYLKGNKKFSQIKQVKEVITKKNE